MRARTLNLRTMKLCRQDTHAPRLSNSLFDHLVGAGE
jgi:hypothetical protein